MTFNFQDWLGPYPDVLHWLPEQDRWETLDCYFTPFGGPHWQPPPGTHHFIICIYDTFGIGWLVSDDENFPDGAEELANLIPHKWSVDADGTITDASKAGLTENDLKDYYRLLKMWESTPADTARLKEISKSTAHDHVKKKRAISSGSGQKSPSAPKETEERSPRMRKCPMCKGTGKVVDK